MEATTPEIQRNNVIIPAMDEFPLAGTVFNPQVKATEKQLLLVIVA